MTDGFGGPIWGGGAKAVYIGRTIPPLKTFFWTHFSPVDYIYPKDDVVILQWVNSDTLQIVTRRKPLDMLGTSKDGIAVELKSGEQ